MAQVFESNLNKCVKRILIQVTEYDKSGFTDFKNSSPYRTEVKIICDAATRDTTEDYDDDSPLGEGERNEVSLFGNAISTDKSAKTVILHSDEFSRLGDILLSMLTTRMTQLDFIVQNGGFYEETVEIPSEVISRCFSLFSILSFDLSSLPQVSTSWPLANFNCKSVSIKNAYIKLNGNSQIIAESIDLSSVYFLKGDAPSYGSYFLLKTDNISVYNVRANFPVSLNCGVGNKESASEYAKTSFTGSDISFDVSEYNDKSELGGVWEDALLRIEGFAKVNLHRFSMFGGAWLKGVRISNCISANVSTFERYASSTDSINTYSLGIGATSSLLVSDFKVKTSTNPTNPNSTFALFIETSTTDITSKVSICDFEVSNILLLNTNGVKADNISFKNGSFEGLSLFETGENTIKEFHLNNCVFTVKNGILVYGKKINITGTKFIIPDEKILQFESDESVKITDSTLAIDNCILRLKQIGECYSLIDHSNIKCKSIEFNGEDYGDETVDGLINKSNRAVGMKASSVHSSKIKISNILGGVKFADSGIHEIESIECSNVHGFKCENAILFSDGYPTKLLFKNDCDVIGSEIMFDDEDSDAADKNIEAYDSKIQSVDVGISNNSKAPSSLNVSINNCPSTRMTFTPDVEELKIKINAKDSLSSIFWGSTNAVTIIPQFTNLSSEDIAAYSSSEENKVIEGKVVYGPSS